MQHLWECIQTQTEFLYLRSSTLSPTRTFQHNFWFSSLKLFVCFFQATLADYQLVFDSVYIPRKTRLLKDAEAAGAIIVGGVEMFLRQAIGQFNLFTDGEGTFNFLHKALETSQVNGINCNITAEIMAWHLLDILKSFPVQSAKINPINLYLLNDSLKVLTKSSNWFPDLTWREPSMLI